MTTYRYHFDGEVVCFPNLYAAVEGRRQGEGYGGGLSVGYRGLVDPQEVSYLCGCASECGGGYAADLEGLRYVEGYVSCRHNLIGSESEGDCYGASWG